MSKPLILKVKGKDTIIKCLQADNSNTYIDGITKAFNYNNISQKSIVMKNICDTGFILPAQVLFTQNDNLGSTFQAYVQDTLVPPQSTVNIPVYYNGIYNGASNSPIYNFVLNGVPLSYQLLVNIPNTAGTITDIILDLDNRVNRAFLPTDFTNHHTDIDGDTIVSVFLYGNVSTITFNDLPYVANTEVFMTNIQAGKLKHIAPDTNNYAENMPDYKIKDSFGTIIT